MRHFKVQALPLEGHKYYRRAGFAWPRGEGYQLVEVVGDKDERVGKIVDGFLCITRETYDILAKDRFLRVVPDGDPLTLFEHAGEVKTLRARIEELEAENADLKAKLEAKAKAK